MLVLVVEDDAVCRGILMRLIRRADPSVQFTVTGSMARALEIVEGQMDALDVVIIDEHLEEGACGSILARQVRNLVPVNTPVLVSASAAASAAGVGGGGGGGGSLAAFDIVWGKPYPSVETIARHLEGVMRRRRDSWAVLDGVD